MNKTSIKGTLGRSIACFMAVMLMHATKGLGDVRGTIIQTDGGKVSGDIRWQPASKAYAYTKGNVTARVKLSNVAEIRVRRPAELDAAIDKVRSGQYAGAIPTLEKIMKTYTMLQWDLTAARWLAEAYLKTGNAKKSYAVAEKVINSRFSSQVPGGIYDFYCDALLQTDQFAKLKRILKRMIEEGDREQAALAQVMRGDIDMKKGNFRDALLNGYLRTVVLFNRVKQVQPKALFKAVRCFEELGETSHAEEMRKILLAKFPLDPYADKIRSGM